MPLNAILAVDFNGLIGLNGDIPWRLPDDMKWFKQHTMGHAVLMGRKTWESLPERFRPLPGRDNYVMTRDQSWSAEGCTALRNVDAVIAMIQEDPEREVFVIGGAEVYQLFAGMYDRVFLTLVMHTCLVANDDDAVYLGPLDSVISGLAVESQQLHEPDDRHELPFMHLTYASSHTVKSPKRELRDVVSDLLKPQG